MQSRLLANSAIVQFVFCLQFEFEYALIVPACKTEHSQMYIWQNASFFSSIVQAGKYKTFAPGILSQFALRHKVYLSTLHKVRFHRLAGMHQELTHLLELSQRKLLIRSHQQVTPELTCQLQVPYLYKKFLRTRGYQSWWCGKAPYNVCFHLHKKRIDIRME